MDWLEALLDAQAERENGRREADNLQAAAIKRITDALPVPLLDGHRLRLVRCFSSQVREAA